ncbi:MAG: lytic transglycosylase domain-containing protein [Chthoniobacterales bacterium]
MASRSERSQIRRLPSLLVSWLIKLALVLLLSAVAAVGYLVLRTKDPLYVVRELKNWSDFKQYDSLITQIANEHLLDPRLVKAVVWRESQFQTDMVGRNNERGLMQVSEIAAREWAKSNAVPNFEPNQLFNPEVNLEIGCWYLSKALQRWNSQTEPVPFALAEYNAGKSRVDRWIRVALQRNKQPLSAEAFEDSIDFPSTAHYVRTILARYDYYKRRGPLAGENQQTSAAE